MALTDIHVLRGELKGFTTRMLGVTAWILTGAKYVSNGKHREKLNSYFYAQYTFSVLITVAKRSKAWTVFSRADAGIMGSNPTQRMDV
jgi:hypothetical protein